MTERSTSIDILDEAGTAILASALRHIDYAVELCDEAEDASVPTFRSESGDADLFDEPWAQLTVALTELRTALRANQTALRGIHTELLVDVAHRAGDSNAHRREATTGQDDGHA